MARHSTQPKPQSIIHHLGRLGSKVTRPLSSFHKISKSWDADGSTTELSYSASMHSAKSLPRIIKMNSLVNMKDDSNSFSSGAQSFGGGDSDSVEEIVHGSLSDVESISTEEEDSFETMNQNEFLFECFTSNGRSDIISFVHFFAEDSKIAGEVEKSILRLVKRGANSANCQCIRVNSRLAPLFTVRLGIDPKHPTVVAIKNGKLIARISDFSSGVREEIEHWIEANGFLDQTELFVALSTISTSVNL